MAKTRLTLTIDTETYDKFNRLGEEYKRVFGARPLISQITNDALKEYVKVMEIFLDKHGEGKLTEDYMMKYYKERSAEDIFKVVDEAIRTRP